MALRVAADLKLTRCADPKLTRGEDGRTRRPSVDNSTVWMQGWLVEHLGFLRDGFFGLSAFACTFTGLDPSSSGLAAVPVAMRVIAGRDDVTVMGEPVEQCGGHLGVAEDAGPFTEVQIGGDNHAGTLVELAQQVEQQCAAAGTEGQIAQFVEDHQIHTHQAGGDASSAALGFLLLQRIDQINRGEEAHTFAVTGDSSVADGDGQMGLAGAGAADQHHVVRRVGEAAFGVEADPKLTHL
jgi:hypothetical protein